MCPSWWNSQTRFSSSYARRQTSWPSFTFTTTPPCSSSGGLVWSGWLGGHVSTSLPLSNCQIGRMPIPPRCAKKQQIDCWKHWSNFHCRMFPVSLSILTIIHFFSLFFFLSFPGSYDEQLRTRDHVRLLWLVCSGSLCSKVPMVEETYNLYSVGKFRDYTHVIKRWREWMEERVRARESGWRKKWSR